VTDEIVNALASMPDAECNGPNQVSKAVAGSS
jgi:hypothetical protein